MVKRLLITDPAYILPQKTYSRIVDTYLKDNNENSYKTFYEQLAKALEELSGAKAYVESTGFGDWVNTIYSSDPDKIINDKFAADTGLVCVCEKNAQIEKSIKENFPYPELCIAEIIVEDTYTVSFDTRIKDWTIVNIDDNNTAFNSSIPEDI